MGVEGIATTGVEGVGKNGVEGVTTMTEWNMPASTLFTKAIGELDATATTIMTVAGVGTTVDMVPPTSVLTTEGTSKGARWETAALITASQAAVLLVETGAVVDFATAENTDMLNVTGTWETTVPAIDLKSISGPQAVTVELVETCQSTAPAQDPRPEQVVVASGLETVATMMPANTQAILLRLPVVNGWARDARMVEGIFQIMEGMEPPWITLNVMEVAAVRYPDVDRETLRLIIMTVMMSQRRCVVRLTRAELRLGPRTDHEGNAFIELDLDFADRYSTSH